METGVLLFVKDNYWNIIVMQCFVILKKVKTQTGFSAFYLFLLAMTSRSLKRKR